jgi:hypothetical protein
MKGPARCKCLCCKEFYHPDHRNLRHQRYCSKPGCRKASKAQSQRCWQQRPENQNYFRGPKNSRRVKECRKRHPGYWRRKKTSVQLPLQEVCQEQVVPNEGVSSEKTSVALQEVVLMQPAVVVGLISILTGDSLQEDIAATARVLIRKGQDILESNPRCETTQLYDENQTTSLSQRVRRVPRQFSWIDQRLVRDGHISRCGECKLWAFTCY